MTELTRIPAAYNASVHLRANDQAMSGLVRQLMIWDPVSQRFFRHTGSLHTSKDNQHEHHDDDQAQSPARIVTPAAAVRPRRQSANKQKNQNDQQNG